MKLLPSVVRQWMRAGIARCGYDLVNRREFGHDWKQDVATLCGAQPPEMIFDVGANKGQCLFELLAQFPNATFHTFEPFPEVYQQLAARVKDLPKVTAHQLALGEVDGTKALHLNQASDTNSFLANAAEARQYAPPGWVDPVGEIAVPIRTLDTFCAEQRIARIDLLKIDSQGYELKILAGGAGLLAARRVRFLLLEVLFVPLYEGQPYFEDVYAHLKRQGFGLIGLYEQNRNKTTKALTWCDALFVAANPKPAG